MKHLFALTFLFTFQIVNGQNQGSNTRLLEPVDGDIVNCGRTQYGPQEKCKLTITNNTEQALQGYWLNWYGQAVKVKFAQVKPASSKTINVYTNEYWVLADPDLNAVGAYEPLPGTNQIVVNTSDLERLQALDRPITDREIGGTYSGGKMLPEQLAYDVLKYDLSLEINPDRKFIKGSNVITIKVLKTLENFVFDLDTLLSVEEICLVMGGDSFPLSRKLQQGKHWCLLPEPLKEGEIAQVKIKYYGTPREATKAPKNGGFSWNKTSNCEHWIATSCQVDGADLWFPCKDYQWDEPDSVHLRFTVPKGLQAISNGILMDTMGNQNGTTTFFWKIRNPINNYGISLNIAPYNYFPDNYVSSSGDSLALGYWLLPENTDKAGSFYTHTKDYLKFLERHLGPYPFRNEKLGIVEVPFVGMEHQTIIGLGPWYD